MKHYPFVYQATVGWFEDEETPNIHFVKYRIAGVGFCKSFTDAASQIETREGENLVSIDHIELIGEEDETLIEIPSTWVRPLIETDSWNYMEEVK